MVSASIYDKDHYSAIPPESLAHAPIVIFDLDLLPKELISSNEDVTELEEGEKWVNCGYKNSDTGDYTYKLHKYPKFTLDTITVLNQLEDLQHINLFYVSQDPLGESETHPLHDNEVFFSGRRFLHNGWERPNRDFYYEIFAKNTTMASWAFLSTAFSIAQAPKIQKNYKLAIFDSLKNMAGISTVDDFLLNVKLYGAGQLFTQEDQDSFLKAL